MKIVHVSTYTRQGGAAIAAYRMFEAMKRAGMDVSFLSRDDFYPNFPIWRTKITQKMLHLAVKRKMPWHLLDTDISVISHPAIQEADVIYLHWVNDFLGIKAIDELLALKKRIIWVQHDMWALTGGCHYSLGCVGYQVKCQRCNQMNRFKDLASKQLQTKIEHWSTASNLTIAAPSQMMLYDVKFSKVFGSLPTITINNLIDIRRFKPINKTLCRSEMGLDVDKKYILFNAVDLANPYKGGERLIQVLQALKDSPYEFLFLGKANYADFPKGIHSKLHLMGYTEEEEQIIRIYNCANVLLMTSVAENFPNVVLEAMACGVPAVAFKAGGVIEQILHRQTGYLVFDNEIENCINGIQWVLNNPDYCHLSQQSRFWVIKHHAYENILNYVP